MCLDQPSIAPAPPARAEPPDPHARRNYVLGVLSGAAGTMGFNCLHPELLLAGLVYALTGNAMMVALVTVVSKAGVLAPQWLVGARVEHYRLKRPYFLALGLTRVAALVGMAACMTQLRAAALSATDAAPLVGGAAANTFTAVSTGVVPPPAVATATGGMTASLVLFFLAYLAANVCGGATHVVFMDMAGRMVPTEKVGSYFGLRHALGGGMAALLAVVLIQPVLGASRLTLPNRYLLIVTIGVALNVANIVLFALCREQPGPKVTRRTTLAESLRRGVGWLRTDRDYRAYFWQRVAFRVNYLGLAFYIPFGADTLATSREEMALLGGIMIATFTLSRTLSSAVWGRVADRAGYRRCMLFGGLLFVAAPALALAATVLPAWWRCWRWASPCRRRSSAAASSWSPPPRPAGEAPTSASSTPSPAR